MKSIDPAKTADELVGFIKHSFEREGMSRAILALSGGVDSGTSAALAARALGPENVTPALLPYGDLNEQGTKDAWDIIRWLKIPEKFVIEVDIQPLVDPILSLDSSMDPVRGGNAMARMRMIILFDQAKKHRAMVVGTENKSEHLLGYFTRFGDGASDLEPLRNLYKTHVYELGQYLELPVHVLTKPPSAGLWKDQTDEGEFGFSYTDADEILSLLHDEHKSPDEIVAAGWDKTLVDKVVARMKANEFKHQVPYIP